MNHLQRLSKYGLVAVGSAASDWVIFTVLVTTGLAHPLVGQMISRIAGGVFSFTANKYWSFKSAEDRKLVMEVRRFLLLYAFSYCLAIVIFYVLFDLLQIQAFITKLATDTLIFFVNYILMNGYVFDGRDGISARMKTVFLSGWKGRSAGKG
jgi:putative flippase GtrA